MILSVWEQEKVKDILHILIQINFYVFLLGIYKRFNIICIVFDKQ